MGLTYATIEVINLKDMILHESHVIGKEKIRQATVNFLVDSGAYMLCLNQTLKAQLGLETKQIVPGQLADGSVIDLEMAGPVEIRFENRIATVDCIILLGDAEPLLGAIPMEAMDVILHPLKQQLIVNPAHPMRPQFSLK